VRRFLTTVMALGLLAGAARAADDDPEPAGNDVSKLVGKWEATEFRLKGQAIPFPGDTKMTFEFNKDGTLSGEGGLGGGGKGGKWKVNAKKTPRHLDVSDGNVNTAMIYKLEKDVLTIAGAEPNGKERPKDFDSAGFTLIFKRAKKK